MASAEPRTVGAMRLVCRHWLHTVNTHLEHLAPGRLPEYTADIWTKFRALRSLDLLSSKLSAVQPSELCEFARHMPNLEHLAVRGGDPESDAGVHPTSAWRRIFRSLPHLQSLSIQKYDSFNARALSTLPKPGRLTSLDLSHSKVTMRGLGVIAASCSHLVSLTLAACDMRSCPLASLSPLKDLQHLDLSRIRCHSISAVTDANLERLSMQGLSSLTKVTYLSLAAFPWLHDDVVSQLCLLTTLKHLDVAADERSRLRINYLSPTSLAPLSLLVDLESLSMSHRIEVMDRDLEWLTTLTALSSLHLNSTRVAHHMASAIALLPRLEHLNLENCTCIFDDHIRFIGDKCRALKYTYIGGCKNVSLHCMLRFYMRQRLRQLGDRPVKAAKARAGCKPRWRHHWKSPAPCKDAEAGPCVSSPQPDLTCPAVPTPLSNVPSADELDVGAEDPSVRGGAEAAAELTQQAPADAPCVPATSSARAPANVLAVEPCTSTSSEQACVRSAFPDAAALLAGGGVFHISDEAFCSSSSLAPWALGSPPSPEQPNSAGACAPMTSSASQLCAASAYSSHCGASRPSGGSLGASQFRLQTIYSVADDSVDAVDDSGHPGACVAGCSSSSTGAAADGSGAAAPFSARRVSATHAVMSRSRPLLAMAPDDSQAWSACGSGAGASSRAALMRCSVDGKLDVSSAATLDALGDRQSSIFDWNYDAACDSSGSMMLDLAGASGRPGAAASSLLSLPSEMDSLPSMKLPVPTSSVFRAASTSGALRSFALDSRPLGDDSSSLIASTDLHQPDAQPTLSPCERTTGKAQTADADVTSPVAAAPDAPPEASAGATIDDQLRPPVSGLGLWSSTAGSRALAIGQPPLPRSLELATLPMEVVIEGAESPTQRESCSGVPADDETSPWHHRHLPPLWFDLPAVAQSYKASVQLQSMPTSKAHGLESSPPLPETADDDDCRGRGDCEAGWDFTDSSCCSEFTQYVWAYPREASVLMGLLVMWVVVAPVLLLSLPILSAAIVAGALACCPVLVLMSLCDRLRSDAPVAADNQDADD